ncbi:hypothetical protein HNQ51_001704 [Inhella inkyongensis]|uniref:DUF4845 domain-containing protein n=1 Tax=Inhella inkyongensis TaxID=392593 RepID=A0A840S7G2_9BURK|nr:DUF4845 domain-containing protein [Inhella inkyongensis]MBB5204390.1 hypothetical protein [Inhella inkyongensis]
MRRLPSRQRGVSLFGLLFWGVVIAFTVVVGAKIVPTVMEYSTILRAVNKVAQSNPATVAAARAEFARTKDVEYSIQIDPNSLQITKENDKVKISFAYEREIALGGPVFLLLKYEGESK